MPDAETPLPKRRSTAKRSLLRQSESLREVIEEISSVLEPRPLLTSIVRHACELLGAYDGSIGLFDEARNVIRIEAIYRMPESEIGAEVPPGVGLAGLVLEARGPVVLARYGDVPQPTLPELADNPVLGMPIVWRERMIGFFGIGARPPRRFDEGDVELLELFARHAAIAIENARLYERAQRVAVLEERARLSRDLHDSVAQKLFSLSLIAQSIDAAWRRAPAEGERRTARLVDLSGEALTEMRCLLRELRPPEADGGALPQAAPEQLKLEEDGLVPALRRLARESSRDGLRVDLATRGYGAPIAVPAELEENLFRMAQEALHNAAKHAGASEVTLLLSQEGPRIQLKVIDDGVGIEPGPASRGEKRGREGGLGLLGIRERAAAFGGRLRVSRRPGGGTIVQVVVYLKPG